MNPVPTNQLPLTAGQRSLLRAARLIQFAHDEARLDTIRACGVFPSWLEQDCGTLLLLAVTLLPEGLPLTGATPGLAGCVNALSVAEAELRRLPIYAYPPGTSRLVVMLCDVLAAARKQPQP